MNPLTKNSHFLCGVLIQYFQLTKKGLLKLEREAREAGIDPKFSLPGASSVSVFKRTGHVSTEMFQQIISAMILSSQLGVRTCLPDGREVTESNIRHFLWQSRFDPKLLFAALTRVPPDIHQILEQGDLITRTPDVDLSPLLRDSKYLEALQIPYFKGDENNERGLAHLKVVSAVVSQFDATECQGNVASWHQVAAELSYRYAAHGSLHRAVDGMQFVQETSRPKNLTSERDAKLEYLIGDYGCVLTPRLIERLPVAARDWPDLSERANMMVKAQHCIGCTRFRQGRLQEASSALDEAEFMLMRLSPNAISPGLRHLRLAYILLIRSKLHYAKGDWYQLALTADESVREFRVAASESIDHVIAQAYSFALLAGAHLYLGHLSMAVMAAIRAEELFKGCKYQFSCLFDYPKVRAALQAIIQWNGNAGAIPEFDLNAWKPEGLQE